MVIFAMLYIITGGVVVVFSYAFYFYSPIETKLQPGFAIALCAQMCVCAALGLASVGTTHHSNLWVPRGLAIANVVVTALLLLDGIIPGGVASGIYWSVWIANNCIVGAIWSVCQNPGEAYSDLAIRLSVTIVSIFVLSIIYLILSVKWLMKLQLDEGWHEGPKSKSTTNLKKNATTDSGSAYELEEGYRMHP